MYFILDQQNRKVVVKTDQTVFCILKTHPNFCLVLKKHVHSEI